MRRVVVTGLGVVTPLGAGVRHVWKQLLDGQHGFRRFPAAKVGNQKLPCSIVATVPRGTGPGEFDASPVVGKQSRIIPPFAALALGAAEEALQDAKWGTWGPAGFDRTRTGVAIGSGIGSFDDTLEAGFSLFGNPAEPKQASGYRQLSPYAITRILPNMAAGHVSIRHGFQGPCHSAATACTTGAHSLGDAYRMIQLDDADVMVAGGVDSSISPLAIAMFARCRALSTHWEDKPDDQVGSASRPFDALRDGFVMGEGAGVMILEERQHALNRGAHIYAEVRGYGMSGDAHHITAPAEDGSGAFRCMQAAFRSSNGLTCHDLDYINAHATSTPLGDSIECSAIKRLIATHDATSRLAHNPAGSALNISSTKSSIGHTLGGAGAIESVFCVMAIESQAVPPTLNLTNPDPKCTEEGLPSGHRLDCTPLHARSREVRVALNNSFGFGGTNASVLFAKPDYRFVPKSTI